MLEGEIFLVFHSFTKLFLWNLALSIDSINPQAYYNENLSMNNDITLRDHWSVTGLSQSVTVMSQNIIAIF